MAEFGEADKAVIRGMNSGKRFFMELGKLLIFLGTILLVAGVVVLLLARMNLPLGRLPGDITLSRAKMQRCIFRWQLLGSCLSIVLSIVLYLLSKWRR